MTDGQDEPTGLTREFEYVEGMGQPSSAFPKGRAIHRPRLPVTLRTIYDGWLSCYAVVDSGADYCSFPQSFMKPLGIEPLEFENVQTANGDALIYFGHVQIDLEFVEPYYVYAGFHPGDVCLLGQDGFFDRFHVAFSGSAKRWAIIGEKQGKP